jgi:hypothetical protein
MDLLERYLQEVRFWLPREQRQDIVNELSEELRSQIEEQEAVLGRALSEAELEALLQRWGSPLLVAERYLPQRHLIGPVMFPLYALVLKWLWLLYMVPWLLVWLFYVAFIPSYRLEHPGLALIGTLRPWVYIAINSFAFITLGFAIAERTQARSGFLGRWNPRKLPALRDPNRIYRSDSIGELVGSAVFLLWWLGVLRLPQIPGLRITLEPAIVHAFRWPVLLLVLASAGLAAVNAVRPIWTPLRSRLRLAVDAASLVLTGFLLAAGPPWIELLVPSLPTAKAAEIARLNNQIFVFVLLAVLVIQAVRIALDVRRIVRQRATPAGGLTAAGGSTLAG